MARPEFRPRTLRVSTSRVTTAKTRRAIIMSTRKITTTATTTTSNRTITTIPTATTRRLPLHRRPTIHMVPMARPISPHRSKRPPLLDTTMARMAIRPYTPHNSSSSMATLKLFMDLLFHLLHPHHPHHCRPMVHSRRTHRATTSMTTPKAIHTILRITVITPRTLRSTNIL